LGLAAVMSLAPRRQTQPNSQKRQSARNKIIMIEHKLTRIALYSVFGLRLRKGE
jgi:hypothetical protein